MKTSINIFNRLSNTEILNLTNVVKETLADMNNHKPTKTFCAADLWNIQRRKKSTMSRRYFL